MATQQAATAATTTTAEHHAALASEINNIEALVAASRKRKATVALAKWRTNLWTNIAAELSDDYHPTGLKKGRKVYVIDADENELPVLWEGKIARKQKGDSSWDVELAGAAYALTYPAWSIFVDKKSATKVLQRVITEG